MRVYVNGNPVDAPDGGTALDAVRVWSASEGDALATGERVLHDSRGLPTPPDTLLHRGAIFRVLPVRRRESPGDAAGTDS